MFLVLGAGCLQGLQLADLPLIGRCDSLLHCPGVFGRQGYLGDGLDPIRVRLVYLVLIREQVRVGCRRNLRELVLRALLVLDGFDGGLYGLLPLGVR